MFWMSRPPYWRWLLAALVVAGAAYMDLAGPAAEAYPFVAKAAAAGEPVEIEWRRIPQGLLPASGAPPATTWRDSMFRCSIVSCATAGWIYDSVNAESSTR